MVKMLSNKEKNMKQTTNPTNYLNKKVKAIIDRPIGSKHPTEKMIYPINYGYIPNTKSGDGEDLDCYILGVEEAMTEFEGICIAVIHRFNDNEDKLVLAPTGKQYTNEEIEKQTKFQEQYFISSIIR